jgi:hypothetical protein
MKINLIKFNSKLRIINALDSGIVKIVTLSPSSPQGMHRFSLDAWRDAPSFEKLLPYV